jgi:hypothetical protein
MYRHKTKAISVSFSLSECRRICHVQTQDQSHFCKCLSQRVRRICHVQTQDQSHFCKFISVSASVGEFVMYRHKTKAICKFLFLHGCRRICHVQTQDQSHFCKFLSFSTGVGEFVMYRHKTKAISVSLSLSKRV